MDITSSFGSSLEEPSLGTTLKCVYFIYTLLPLHVSALVGHLQEEYTTVSSFGMRPSGPKLSAPFG
jgi:hypothetical protein